jgi:hypothetical protein
MAVAGLRGGTSPASGAGDPRVRHKRKRLAQKDGGGLGVLTVHWVDRKVIAGRPAIRLRGGVQAELGRSSRRRRCGGAPSLLIRPIDPCRSCGGIEGVRKVQGSPASRNRTTNIELTRVGPERFWQLQGMGIGIAASGGSLVSSRTGQWLVGAGTQQGAGSAATQGHGVAGIRGGGGTRAQERRRSEGRARGGCGGLNKGRPGHLGSACPMRARWHSRRAPRGRIGSRNRSA